MPNRSQNFWPINTTTIDTGAGIDIRFLDSNDPGTGSPEATQTATATHTEDNVERTFDPDTLGVTNTNDCNTTCLNSGWAVADADMIEHSFSGGTSKIILTAGTLTVGINVTVNQSGGTYAAGTHSPNWKASLWKWDESTDNGNLINFGTSSSTSWNYTPGVGDLGVFKTVSIPIVLASNVEFGISELLMIQIGLNTATIPNPTLGTPTITFTLRSRRTDTKITFAAGQGLRYAVANTPGDVLYSVTGKGRATKTIDVPKASTSIGKGILTHSKPVGIPRTLIGKGIQTHSKLSVVTIENDLIGIGTVTRGGLIIPKEYSLIGKGDPTHSKASVVARTNSLIGIGTPSASKVTVASKLSELIGVGTPTASRVAVAAKSFELIGRGIIPVTGDNASTITLPIDEVPEGGGASTTHIFGGEQ